MTDLVMHFPDDASAHEFMIFMIESGEQFWYDWVDMGIEYGKPAGPITFKDINDKYSFPVIENKIEVFCTGEISRDD